ncbi:hypothetical protein CCACVL1_05723 [Corchorus capsularis]|uniref:Uncharacterized protein n=1 Tax=Corchorus capsularis TaxID=210143 RepID=A0A1R3JJ99_COCAP|nr:hypothetical protein CCACVL1_05723 [Corchorus capsularis]
MARGIPSNEGDGSSCDGGGGGGSGRHQSTTTLSFPSSSTSSYLHVDSFHFSSLDRGSIGDVFFGSDDISDTKDLDYKEDVLESYRKETAMKSLRRRAKKGSFGCLELLKFLCSCCRCIF